MLGQYRAVFRAPGSAAFSAASFVMRLPIAVYPIGIVLIISARDGRYAFAGVLSACYTFAGAVGMPALSVLIDRFGQRRLVLPATAVHVAGVVTLAVLVRTDAAHWLLVLPTVLFGFSYLSVGSLVRARWNFVLDDQPELSTALSLESVIDEVIFVVGPLIATVIATQVAPVLVLWVAAGIVAAGALWLATLHASEPPVHVPDGTAHPFALRARGMPLLVLTTLPIGAVFASAELSAVAFCGQHGHRALSGVALAAIAGASAVSGLFYGARVREGDVLTRFWRQSLVFAVLPVVLLAAVNVPLLLVADVALGLGIAPTLITAFGLVQRLVAPRALTEGLSWINTGLGVGYGLGSAIVGGIADQHGARSAFWVVIGAALVVGVLATALRAQLRVDRDGGAAGGGASGVVGGGAAGAPSEAAAGTGWDTR
ncbi:MFS transporter [uncultured Jatrophihabitans sp.]|uniref:MFS transporter n=1 Tax=uncultured Jatrophihabitans sp. TaxID=1610747 RepID=UPI0035CC8DF7